MLLQVPRQVSNVLEPGQCGLVLAVVQQGLLFNEPSADHRGQYVVIWIDIIFAQNIFSKHDCNFVSRKYSPFIVSTTMNKSIDPHKVQQLLLCHCESVHVWVIGKDELGMMGVGSLNGQFLG